MSAIVKRSLFPSLILGVNAPDFRKLQSFDLLILSKAQTSLGFKYRSWLVFISDLHGLLIASTAFDYTIDI
jgi:hypothetical protein